MAFLSDKITVNKRYYRSINLERDFDNPDSVTGFVVTSKVAESLEQLCDGFSTQRGCRAWTLTGPYGTGKSSFLQFFLSLLGPKTSKARSVAEAILQSSKYSKIVLEKAQAIRSAKGCVRCIATCRLESVSHAVLRALRTGTENCFGAELKSQGFWKLLNTLCNASANGQPVDDSKILQLIKQIGVCTNRPMVIVLDELGKCLEFASRRKLEDLYLLQQLAELPDGKDHQKTYVIGLLHQGFSDYADLLSQSSRNEWAKVQGRFRDVPFTESLREAVALLSNAITIKDKKVQQTADFLSKNWTKVLKDKIPASLQQADSVFPLHPLAAILIPNLCAKLGQNERSLFTLITSDEPGALTPFLESIESLNDLSSYKLFNLYDYLSQSGLKASGNHGLGVRWTEIEERVSSQSSLSIEDVQLLKTIGLFNLVSTAGSLRASKKLVSLSMIDNPEKDEIADWEKRLDALVKNNILVYRRQLDEYRLWDGTDFDFDDASQKYRSKFASGVRFASALSSLQAIGPITAQKHSYQSGNTRLFESVYCDENDVLKQLVAAEGADGLVVYWVGAEEPHVVPSMTSNSKPLLLVLSSKVSDLHATTTELVALQTLLEESAELQVDRVARKEVTSRLIHAKHSWEAAFHHCFGFSAEGTDCVFNGVREKVTSGRRFNSILSEICDLRYNSAPTLWNELINRRELTSQGSKARRELIEAMLSHESEPSLALEGFGPEVSMYKSVLEATGIHREIDGRWQFSKPSDETFVPIWTQLNKLIGSKSRILISDIFSVLEGAPFGAKAGVIPILLAAYFTSRKEDLSLYKDGTFIGSLACEHYELLVKDASRFAVKSLEEIKAFSNLFESYCRLLISSSAQDGSRLTQSGVLSVVKPLINFVRRLPVFSQNCKSRFSRESVAVRDCILNAKEPDSLLFSDLPLALGYKDVLQLNSKKKELSAFEENLSRILNELNGAYANLIKECESSICKEFGVKGNSFEQILERLVQMAPELERSEFAPLVFQISNHQSLSIDEAVRRFAMVIADKPPESWNDSDLELFPNKAKVYINRLRNFEALQSEMKVSVGSDQTEFETSRITVVARHGEQINKLIKLNKTVAKEAEIIADKIMREYALDSAELKEAIIAKLAERILGDEVGNASRS